MSSNPFETLCKTFLRMKFHEADKSLPSFFPLHTKTCSTGWDKSFTVRGKQYMEYDKSKGHVDFFDKVRGEFTVAAAKETNSMS